MTTPTFADVFRELNDLRTRGIIREYALGGATAVAFYAEPTPTYDIDVFVLLSKADESTLNPLNGIYRWAETRGFDFSAEHIMIHGVAVQFLPAHDALAKDAVDCALEHEYLDVPVRVVPPEHLAAMALQAGDRRRRERAWLLIESGKLDRKRLQRLLIAHDIEEDIGNE